MTTRNPYSGHKALWHTDRLSALRAGRQPNPVHVQLIISDLCNHDCTFCAYRMSGYTSNQLFGVKRSDGSVNNNPARMIPTEKCYEILNDCSAMQVKAIQFTGGGEPTVHKDHELVFAHALDNRLDCALVSNGYHWSLGLISETLPRFAWVRVSLDAGTAETYAAVRRVKPSVFASVLRNLEDLAKQDRRDDARLGVGFVVTRENFREVAQATKIARDHGADNIRIGAVFSTEGPNYYDGFWLEARDAVNEAVGYSAPDFAVYDLFGQRMGDLVQHSPDYEFCGFEHFTTYIGGDLNVYRCCNTAYNAQGLIGSLADQSFAALWASQQKQAAFANFDARTCELCQFNDKNRAINAALERPEHEGFV